jgi:formylglycine-generating enzyme required for sulfatase activity
VHRPARRAGLGVTSPVGLFPRARQAELGIEDLAGNAWEWCGSLYDPSDINDPNAPRVLRGGSWANYQVSARSAGRGGDNPNNRGSHIGIRVVCSSPINGH